ncbi:protein SOB FIVE-LIKE 6-like [Phoenix dactylifera]|uniref:Protein SOB FIVE-LIKE 6-like n=1 Tax=Phoenix dactylifera TaxID=42345 RepID=A0A8B9AUE6_PHODC|nr:protein SOB FIVE-LIKE 6-like [Phoenix dactylifera]
MMLGVEADEESSECSSGCQSGWTMYLDQSDEPPTSLPFEKAASIEQEEEEEEDLSMVSDASSGPPHFPEEDDNCYYSHSNTCYNGTGCLFYASTLPTASAAALAKNGGKRRRVEGNEQRESSSLLDDTASSPLFSFPDTSFNATSNNVRPSMENVLEFSCGFSATHFKGKSALHKQMRYLHSSAPAKPTPARPVCRDESERKLW